LSTTKRRRFSSAVICVFIVFASSGVIAPLLSIVAPLALEKARGVVRRKFVGPCRIDGCAVEVGDRGAEVGTGCVAETCPACVDVVAPFTGRGVPLRAPSPAPQLTSREKSKIASNDRTSKRIT